MNSSRRILVGLVLGIATGLFFGERAAALKWAADAFVKLLQMTVLPYIVVSVVSSLGSLRPGEVRTLGVRSAAVIAGLWVVALAFAFLIPLTFPTMQNASFFSSSLLETRAPFDVIDLFGRLEAKDVELDRSLVADRLVRAQVGGEPSTAR